MVLIILLLGISLSNKILLEWGKASITSAKDYTIGYPVSYTKYVSVLTERRHTSGSAPGGAIIGFHTSDPTLTSFVVYGYSSTPYFNWATIGY